jgi:hypothetical protein
VAWLERHYLNVIQELFTTFANTLPHSEQRRAYDRHIVPARSRIYFQAALGIGNAVVL